MRFELSPYEVVLLGEMTQSAERKAQTKTADGSAPCAKRQAQSVRSGRRSSVAFEQKLLEEARRR